VPVTRRHFLKAAFGAVGAAALLAVAPQGAAAAIPPKASSKQVFGVSTKGLPDDLGPLQAFVKLVGKSPTFANYYADFTTPAFDDVVPTAMFDAGLGVMLTWQPTNWSTTEPITLQDLLDGKWDTLIHTWARQIAAWGYPLWLRFAHEMNGDWYSWGVQGHNTPAEYRKMWRRVVGIFKTAGAHNVRWVWCPNNTGKVADFYPGDDYVDLVGLDGFNYGSVGTNIWQEPAAIFDPALRQLRSLTSKPILICETGCVEEGGNKAEWIKQFFTWLRSAPVDGFSWFDIDNKIGRYHLSWAVNSSASALAAFRQGIATY
jgi:Glycosyl hydrolase family 26/TAT (twin-arginine translocation) pathway signal sequence